MATALLSFPVTSQADNKADDLQKIGREIRSTEARLKESQQEHSQLGLQLEKTEKTLGRIEAERKQLLQAISRLEQELQALHDEEQTLLQARSRQEEAIADQARASYRLGHEKNLRVMLNQDDSHALGRSLVYSEYIARARLDAIHAYEDTLAGITRNKEAISAKTAELHNNQALLASKADAARETYGKRNAAMQALQASIKTDETRISQLRENQARLQELLRQIRARQLAAEKAAAEKARKDRQRQADAAAQAARRKPTDSASPTPHSPIAPPAMPASHQPFAQAKGRLPWPVQGRIDNRYGKPRPPGSFRWEGVAFIAAAGTDVRAVHGGKVVFADWFRGKGLLLIIDHGNGYMTLYAHNQALLKQAGEPVQAGEVIATVGDSGGLPSAELYFELRHQGETVNPGPWLKRNG